MRSTHLLLASASAATYYTNCQDEIFPRVFGATDGATHINSISIADGGSGYIYAGGVTHSGSIAANIKTVSDFK